MEEMYLPSYMREVAQSGNLNHNQHANYVELLADFAAKRDKEFYALRNELNELKRRLHAQTAQDEALLRQALEALELRCDTNADERKELIPALREMLGDEKG